MGGVGIVILNYNTTQQTLRLIQSIHECHVAYDRIVIVDNCSMIEHPNALTAICNDKIEMIRNQSNYGYAEGNNVGIRYLRKYNIDFIVIINPDIVIRDDGFMSKMLAAYKKGVGVIGVNTILGYEFNIIGGVKEDFSIGFLLAHIWEGFLKRHYLYWPFSYHEIKSKRRIYGCVFILTPDYFMHYSGLWKYTFLYREESILSVLLKKAGLKEVFADTIVFHEQGGATKQFFSNSSRVKRLYELQSSVQQMFVTLMPYGLIRKFI